jgi:hypothetical protein
MTKYSKYQKPLKPRHAVMHPIWRGIGCLMAIILPAISYISAVELVNIGITKGWPIPRDLLGFIQFPEWVWKISLLSNLLHPIATFRNIYAIFVFTFVVLILLSGIFSLFYSILYRFIGPPRLTPVDAPPVKGRQVRKSR